MANLSTTLQNLYAKTAAALAPRPATLKELGEDLAAPAQSLTGDATHSSGQTRKTLEDSFSGDLTPAVAVRAMRYARDLSNVQYFVDVAMEALRRDPHLQSVMQTRVLAVTALPLIAEQNGTSFADKKATQAAQEILSSEMMESILPHLALNGSYLGFGVAQLYIDYSVQPWRLTGIEAVPPRFITFDKNDASTPYMLPAVSGGPLQVLPANKFIFHRPGLIGGNPATSGIAYSVLFYLALKAVTQRGWVGFIELFGQPIRKGEYPAGMGNTPEGKKDLKVMREALQNLGGDSWAMLPAGMKIEIIEAASRSGSAEVFEKFSRYVEELVSKLGVGGTLTGGTGNTGSGGTQALGMVHNNVRMDILEGDAKRLSGTIRHDVVRPFTNWNFAGANVPKAYFQVKKSVDIAAKVKAWCDLSDRGLPVPLAEAYALLDTRAPEGDEPVLTAKAPQAPAVEPVAPKAAMSAKFSANADPASGLDELDALGAELLDGEEYTLADADADEALLSAIEGMAGSNGTALKAALIAAIRTGDVSSMQAVFAAGTTAARLAGDLGAEIGMRA